MSTYVDRVKNEVRSLLLQIGKTNKTMVLSLIGVYIISNMLFMVGWSVTFLNYIWLLYTGLFSFVIWVTAILLFQILADWKQAWSNKGLSFLIGFLLYV